jgi:hypothetical protein
MKTTLRRIDTTNKEGATSARREQKDTREAKRDYYGRQDTGPTPAGES